MKAKTIGTILFIVGLFSFLNEVEGAVIKHRLSKVTIQIPDSIYYRYNKLGILVESGTYRNVHHLGERYVFRDDSTIQLAGYYDSIGRFSGFLFDLGDSELDVEFQKLARQQVLDFPNIQSAIDSLSIVLAQGDYNGEKAFESNVEIFNRLDRQMYHPDYVNKRDSLTLRYVYELSRAVGLYYLFSAEKARLGELYNTLRRKRYDGYKEFIYQHSIAPLLNRIERINDSDDPYVVLSSKIKIEQAVAEADTLNLVYSQMHDNIIKYYTNVVPSIEKYIEQFGYSDSIVRFQFNKYKTIDSLELKFDLGYKIIDELKAVQNKIDQYVSLDEQITNKYDYLLSLENQSIPNYHQKYIAAIDVQIEGLKQIKIRGSEFSLAKGVLRQINELILITKKNLEREKETQLLFADITASYKAEYEKLYKREVSKQGELIDDLLTIGDVEKRLGALNRAYDRLSYYWDAFYKFQHTDSLIATEFNFYKKKYEQYYEDIHDEIVKDTEREIDKFKRERQVNDKLNAIYSIENKISTLVLSYPKLETHRVFVNEKYPSLRMAYRDSFPNVYDEDIDAYNDSIDDYNNSKYINQRLVLGKKAVAGIKQLSADYDSLLIQRRHICSNYFRTKRMYSHRKFEAVYDNEFEDLVSYMTDYGNEGEIALKQKQGRQVLDQSDYMIAVFPDLVYNDSVLSDRLSRNLRTYKERYKKIYRTDIKLHKEWYDEYHKIGYVKNRYERAAELLDTFLVYEGYTNQLEKLTFATSDAWDTLKLYIHNDFVEKENHKIEIRQKGWQKIKKEKQRLRKWLALRKETQFDDDEFIEKDGRKYYNNYLSKQYKKELDILRKIEIANRNFDFVNRLISLQANGTETQKQAFKQAENLEEVLKVLQIFEPIYHY